MISLQPLQESDFDTFISWIENQDYLFQFAGPIFTFPLTKEQLHKYIRDPKRKSFKVIDNETNTMIGHCEFNFENPAIPRLSRILIGDKNYRNKGYGKILVQKMTQTLLEDELINLVDLNVFDWNISAIKCYESVGFIQNEQKTIEHNNDGIIWKALNYEFCRYY